MRSTWSLRGAVAVVALLVVVGGGSFAAGTLVAPAGDRAAPRVNAPASPAFKVGAQLQASPLPGWYVEVPVQLTWTAADPSGICSYSVHGTHGNYGSGFPLWRVANHLRRPAFVTTISDYDEGFGSGGGYLDGFVVEAHDCRFNGAGVVAMDRNPTVWQDDGYTAQGVGSDDGTISYSGGWRIGRCDCASGGTQRWTRRAGATMTITRTFREGDHFALVMAKGADRGRAMVYVDGVAAGRVDTHKRGPNLNRVIVFDRALSAGAHTIRVVNRATPGHPRIDFDGMVVS